MKTRRLNKKLVVFFTTAILFMTSILTVQAETKLNPDGTFPFTPEKLYSVFLNFDEDVPKMTDYTYEGSDDNGEMYTALWGSCTIILHADSTSGLLRSMHLGIGNSGNTEDRFKELLSLFGLVSRMCEELDGIEISYEKLIVDLKIELNGNFEVNKTEVTHGNIKYMYDISDKTITFRIFAQPFKLETENKADAGIQLFVNGQRLVLDAESKLINGRVLVPVRGIFEALGAEVEWVADERKVLGSKDGKFIELRVDDSTAYVNGLPKTLDVPATIFDGRTFVPLRFISEALDASVDWNGDLREVTIELNDKKIVTTPVIPEPMPTQGETISQQNAVESAKSYLEFVSFSRQGLIDQLEYEGFSTEDATYGVEHSGADWNEQAVKSAKEYLEYSSFSRQGLIAQLEYEGFTQDQAVHGVDATGL